jgi:subtilisin family serine protease
MQNKNYGASANIPAFPRNAASTQRYSKLILGAFLGLVTVLMASSLFAADPVALGKIEPKLANKAAIEGSSEALVILSEQADLSGADLLPTKEEKAQFVYSRLREVAERTQAPIRKMLEERGIPYQSYLTVNMIKINGSLDSMYEIAGHPAVLRIESNPHIKVPVPDAQSALRPAMNLSTTQTTNGTGPEWNIKQVNAPQAWAMGYKGQGIVVAGLDTGVQWNHVALINHYRGWNGSTVNHAYNWHDATSTPSSSPVDPQWHGTFTMSEMVGDDGKGNQVGVAPGAKWIACRNMDKNGVGSPATYIECFDWALAPYPQGQPHLANPAYAPDVINNSWACPASEGCSVNTLLTAVNAVKAAGIFPVAAAGNSGQACSSVNQPPAIYASAISVGSTNSLNYASIFSSRGPVTADGSGRLKPEVMAPGENIRGAIPYNNMYQGYWSGTSMAAPHIAGAVAILWQAKPAKYKHNIAATLSVLEQTATHLRSTQSCGSFNGQAIPNAVFGYGLLNILSAVQAP